MFLLKRFLFSVSLLLATLLLTQCNRSKCDLQDSSVVASAAEITTIQNYLSAHSLIATEHSSGFFYSISANGSGSNPNLCSSVTVKYKGSLLSGFVFDQSTTNVSFPLKNLIIGWQKGLPLIKKGGKITLYIPPSLGYGSMSQSSIPANSTLIFDIELVGVEQ